MRATQVAVLGWLAWRYPPLRDLLAEHLQDHAGEVLPHLLIADYERWAETALAVGDPKLRDFLADLEEAFCTGGSEVEELISVSFLEHLPRLGEAGSQLREMVGPSLSDELRVIG